MSDSTSLASELKKLRIAVAKKKKLHRSSIKALKQSEDVETSYSLAFQNETKVRSSKRELLATRREVGLRILGWGSLIIGALTLVSALFFWLFQRGTANEWINFLFRENVAGLRWIGDKTGWGYELTNLIIYIGLLPSLILIFMFLWSREKKKTEGSIAKVVDLRVVTVSLGFLTLVSVVLGQIYNLADWITPVYLWGIDTMELIGEKTGWGYSLVNVIAFTLLQPLLVLAFMLLWLREIRKGKIRRREI